MTGYRAGLLAELWACLYLLGRGYMPCAWRYKTPVGEIDLIVRRGKTIVFVEVKYRADAQQALYALQPRQAGRMQRAVMHYLASHKWAQPLNPRLDLIAISGRGHVQHLDNVV